MITFDQVLLLQEKIESAANKIRQLQAENDALRSKCAELTNAISTKSEQLSTFESEQSKIENGILNALNRLNVIENSLLHSTENSVQSAEQQNQLSNQNQNSIQNQQPNTVEQIQEQNQNTENLNFSNLENVPSNQEEQMDYNSSFEDENSESNEEPFQEEPADSDSSQFDIF